MFSHAPPLDLSRVGILVYSVPIFITMSLMGEVVIQLALPLYCPLSLSGTSSLPSSLSVVSFLCWLLFGYPFHPRVNPEAGESAGGS